MKLPDWWDDFCLVLFVALLLTISIFIAKATAAVPPVSLPADPAPIVYPDQLHPEDVWEMAAIRHWTKEDTAGLVAEFGFPTEMVSIAGCESVHTPTAHRTSTRRTRAEISGPLPTGDYGLWQINWKTWGKRLRAVGIIDSPAELFHPRTNAEAAALVLREQGLRAWNACR